MFPYPLTQWQAITQQETWNSLHTFFIILLLDIWSSWSLLLGPETWSKVHKSLCWGMILPPCEIYPQVLWGDCSGPLQTFDLGSEIDFPKGIRRFETRISDLWPGCNPKVWNHFHGYMLTATEKNIIIYQYGTIQEIYK